MKITRNQLRQLIQEAMPDGGVPDVVGYLSKGQDDIYPGADERGDPDSWDHLYDEDEDGDGVPDNQEGTMDPDREVSLRLGKVRDLLADAEEIAQRAPDHQNKGEGFAMAELQMVVDDLHQMYGTEYWTQG